MGFWSIGFYLGVFKTWTSQLLTATVCLLSCQYSILKKKKNFIELRHLSLTWVLPDVQQQFILYKCTASIKQAKKTVSTLCPINQYKEITVTALFWRWKPMKIKQPWAAGSFSRISGKVITLVSFAKKKLLKLDVSDESWMTEIKCESHILIGGGKAYRC